MIRLTHILLLFLMTATLTLQANDTLRFRFGAYTDFNLNLHSSDFTALPDIPNCCENFSGGVGFAYSIGALFEYPLTNHFMMGIRAGYSNGSGELTATESVKLYSSNYTPIDGEFTHYLNTTITDLGIEPILLWHKSQWNIYFGLRIGFTMASTFEQYEKITNPKDEAVFMDTKTMVRNEHQGDIPEITNKLVSLLVGVGYELPLNAKKTLLLQPEVFYYQGISPIIQDYTWSISNLKAGVALKYSPQRKQKKIELFEEKQVIDTVKIETPEIAENTFILGKPRTSTKTEETDKSIITYTTISRTDTLRYPKAGAIEAQLTLVGIDEAGIEINNPTFKIEEFTSTKSQPILNYIFFDENSAKINERYATLNKNQTKDFSIEGLYQNGIMENYLNILNILGKRLQQNPKATITLTACNADVGAEKDNQILSQKRADIIKSYLVNSWNIAETRFNINARNLPEKPSIPITEPMKMEENRRVEITMNDNSLLAPIELQDTLRVVNPPIAKFKIKCNNSTAVKEWKITASQEGSNNEYQKSGTGAIPPEITWVFEDEQPAIPRAKKGLLYSISIIDKNGVEFTSETKSTTVDLLTISKKRKEKLADTDYDMYNLILFDFDKSNIDDKNKNITRTIQQQIKPTSTIEITGYADITGDAEHNQALSLDRAKATEKVLGIKAQSAVGAGSKTLFDNSLPEGRFFNRTVQISVETPVK